MEAVLLSSDASNGCLDLLCFHFLKSSGRSVEICSLLWMSSVFNANTGQIHLELLDVTVSGCWKSEHVFPLKRKAVSNAILLSSVHVSDRLLGLDVIAPNFEYDDKRKSLMPTNLRK